MQIELKTKRWEGNNNERGIQWRVLTVDCAPCRFDMWCFWLYGLYPRLLDSTTSNEVYQNHKSKLHFMGCLETRVYLVLGRPIIFHSRWNISWGNTDTIQLFISYFTCDIQSRFLFNWDRFIEMFMIFTS